LFDTISLYFKIGFSHIYDFAAVDHILFLVALSALFTIADWRKLLILITAFTIGHSFTLILVSLDAFQINSRFVELLIPITIMLTAVYNFYILARNKLLLSKPQRHYVLALGFGWIHGMAFSNYLRTTLFPGESLLTQLFAFNIGIELGQILIVGQIMLISYILTSIFKIKFKHYAFTLSGLAFALSLYLFIEQW